MPSVATAPTATAAQTSAAGSRMIGFYLGVGGVKVDVLFDTANFVTKNAAGQALFGAGSAAAPSISFTADTDTGFYGGGDVLRAALGGVTRYVLEATGLVPNTANELRLGWAGGRWSEVWTSKVVTPSGVSLSLQAGSGGQWNISQSTGAFFPSTDNAHPLGGASNRPSVLWAATNVISTSDAREKTWRSLPTQAELAAARRIASELGFYQWNDAIAEKGEEGARLHFGARAQSVWAIMADEGLIDTIAEGVTPSSRYAFLCYDEWPEVDAVAEKRDEEGNITVEAVEPREAGNRFGIRPDQLALFLIAAQEARLAALEAAA